MDFTDRQLDIMNILWDRGSATVREAKEEMDEDLAYTSVLTVFQTLEKNGHVDYEREGKAYRYYPTVSRKEAGDAAVDYLLDRVFRGSPEAMVSSLTDVSDGAEERRGEAVPSE
ncbi:MAG: BlaI/MecI/CopY family transcriptional regulator [Gemmatimonadota bacterium]